MTVACPPLQWPTGLHGAGPQQDPSIMLRGVAEIAGASLSVIAIRINPIDMTADRRSGVPTHVYKDYRLTEILDELSQFADISDRSLVQLSTGAYVFLMLPAASD